MFTARSNIPRMAAGKERDISTLSRQIALFLQLPKEEIEGPTVLGKAQGAVPGVSKITPMSLDRHLLLGE